MATDMALASQPGFSVVHRAIGRGFVGTHSAPELSIKCMFNGSARYFTDSGQHYRISDEDFLVLGRGNTYTVEKDPRNKVETFCIFFPPDWVRETAGAVLRAGSLLDDPYAPMALNPYEHRRPHRGPISRRVLALRQRLDQGGVPDGLLAEQLVLLTADLVHDHHAIDRRVAGLPWVRASTRSELFRRVHVGRDYLHAYLDMPFSLEKAARTATLSRYHFLRSFRRIFGRTPLRYVQEQRLRRATALLERSDQSITEIALEVGYESVASFSTFFSRQRGASPLAWRRAHRNTQHR